MADQHKELLPEPKLWERQEGEPLEAYDAFCCYRDAPADARSIRMALTTLYGREPTQAELSTALVWSSQWGWVARTKAWHDELDRLNR